MNNIEAMPFGVETIAGLEERLSNLKDKVNQNLSSKEIKKLAENYEGAVNETIELKDGEDTIENLEERLQILKGENETVEDSAEDNLRNTMQEIVSKFGSSIKKAFDTLATKPAKWMIEAIKNNPIKTIFVVLVIAGLWYYSAPIQYGLSAIPEKGMEIISDVLRNSLGAGADLPSVNEYLSSKY